MKWAGQAIFFVILFIFLLVNLCCCQKKQRVWCRTEDSCDKNILHPSTIPGKISPGVMMVAKKYLKKYNDLLKSGKIVIEDANKSLMKYDKYIISSGYYGDKLFGNDTLQSSGKPESDYGMPYKKVGKRILEQLYREQSWNNPITILIDEISTLLMESNYKVRDAHRIVLMIMKNLCDCRVILS